MNRRVTATLLGTLLALVVATVWVPVRIRFHAPMGGHPLDSTSWGWVWRLGPESIRRSVSLHTPLLAVQCALVVALGGLLALCSRTRRQAASA